MTDYPPRERPYALTERKLRDAIHVVRYAMRQAAEDQNPGATNEEITQLLNETPFVAISPLVAAVFTELCR
jgi:hypothetical protein